MVASRRQDRPPPRQDPHNRQCTTLSVFTFPPLSASLLSPTYRPPARSHARSSQALICPRHAADARAYPFTRRGKTPAVTDTLLPTPGPRHTRIADQLAHPSTPAFIRLSHKSRRTRVGRRRRRPRRNIPHHSAPCPTAADTRTYASASRAADATEAPA